MSLSHGNAPRPSGGARMARTAGMLALFTLLSRLLGLVRDMGIRVESLARIASMDENGIVFIPEEE